MKTLFLGRQSYISGLEQASGSFSRDYGIVMVLELRLPYSPVQIEFSQPETRKYCTICTTVIITVLVRMTGQVSE
jgi:hypothetical protein